MTSSFDPEGHEAATLASVLELTGARVLEIGAGDGRLTWQYAARAHSVIGTDTDAESVAYLMEDRPPGLWARNAVADVMNRGLFALQQAGSFYSSSYWDSVAELREYLKDWFDVARLPRRLAGEARTALRRAGSSGRRRLKTSVGANTP